MKKSALLLAASFLASTALAVAQQAPASPTTSSSTTSTEAPATPKPACGGDLKTWLDGVAAEARADGIGDKGINELYQAQIDPKVLARDTSQGATFNQTFADFSRKLISDARLKKGREMLVKYADVFKKAEETYGVPGPVIAAFWGLETDYGAIQGNFDTLNALVTLSHDCRRPELFRPQLIALLKLFDQGVVNAQTTGAWAGEIGQMQMLPLDYLERGTDGDGDGRVDLQNSAPDAIMTAARMISDLGWQKGQPWLEEVRLTKDLPWEQAIRTNRLPHSKWAAWGVEGMNGPLGPDDGNASLLLPMGRKGPAFLSYPNFDVFVEWNKSIVYATTVAYFATRLAGAPAFELGNPDPGLSTDQMKELQTKLAARGYAMGKIDGVYGLATRDAVRTEQQRLGMPADSWPTVELLNKL
ncbi:lytic murein transglycosylase [Phyllobacterium leguminum]|uniref:Lytic murein transglycosylase n=1 Tax=Phyllobacterium leguminum TaxID=314237 RepID=A0A318T722_9HYPH|nr:lytic murein transglycosylase [Phyllobacterium leguminum]PYE90191.1 lytic murein transglycosylase [Phyllobacterium leguminum]